MSCTSCNNCKTPQGCGNNGNCGTGGCNKLNTFDWLSIQGIDDAVPCSIVEVSFKHGSTKGFYKNPNYLNVDNGDMVVVDTGSGYDVGQICLKGELVRLQLKKKKVDEFKVNNKVLRKANDRDLEKLSEARKIEHRAMVRARTIARTLGLEMKIGDVQYQGDLRKATFFYIANGRVDFRELVRTYASEFKVKIEMRQIGARQEAGMIGGIGSCGRELCCSTWLTDFKTVTTTAARYQNLSINQSKLTGQCGRLKCCLNYELDMYIEALQKFPDDAEKLYVKTGVASLVKIDIFKEKMYYNFNPSKGRNMVIGLDINRVKYLRKLNKKKKKADELVEKVVADENIQGNTGFTGNISFFHENE